MPPPPPSVTPRVRVWASRAMPRVAAVLTFCALCSAAMPRSASAQEATTTITIGESNSPAQMEEILAAFEARGDEPVATVTVDETARAMDGIYDTSGITSAYSSTALTCRSEGEGLEVVTRNITVVPPALYAMALATAGIDDATLIVAAPADAPAEGMTALTGIFATAETSPCPSSASDPNRRRLALEELTLTTEMAAALGGDAARAAAVVLEVQQAVVSGRSTNPGAIEAAIRAQEEAAEVAIPDEQRARLVDLMARLAAANLDWGSFAAGWDLGGDQAGTGVVLTGRAVGGAVTTATAAPPTPAPTATPQPTATATPSPTATPTPEPTPTPTPAPFTVTGRVVDAGGDWIVVGRAGATGAPETYAVGPAAAVSRAGAPSTAGRIEPDDAVVVTVAGDGERALEIAAEPPAGTGLRDRLLGLWPLLLGGFLVSAAAAGAAARRRGRVLGYLVRAVDPPPPAASPLAGTPPAPERRRLRLLIPGRDDRPGQGPS